jgi:hypothetical protein
MSEIAKPETVHLVLIDAHHLDKILTTARRRRKAGTIMMIAGAYMALASAMRRRHERT